MFKMLGNLTKAAVAVAVTPITLAVDVVAIPFDSTNDKDFAHRTTKKLEQAGRAFDAAVEAED